MVFAFLIQHKLSAGEVAWNAILEMVQSFWARVPYIFVGILVFLFFLLIAKIAKGAIRKTSARTNVDPMLAELLSRLSTIAIVFLGLSVAAIVIIPTFRPGDLIAGLGITSVALGFAFKEVLQNFFAGTLLLWQRPFVVGDLICVKDFEGHIEEIKVSTTRINTPDGESVVIPNSELFLNEVIVRTANENRRVRFAVGIAYPESIEKAREVIQGCLEKTEGVLTAPVPSVNVVELADSSVNFEILFWIKSKETNLAQTKDKVATNIKHALDNEGIEIPFPHSVVFLHNDSIKQLAKSAAN